MKALPELQKLPVQATIEASEVRLQAGRLGRPFARQLGGREGAPMRFSREVMQTSAGSEPSGTHAT